MKFEIMSRIMTSCLILILFPGLLLCGGPSGDPGNPQSPPGAPGINPDDIIEVMGNWMVWSDGVIEEGFDFVPIPIDTIPVNPVDPDLLGH